MECKHAYQALSDTKQRSRYDREQVLSHDPPLVSKCCTRRAALRTLLWRSLACLSCIQPALRWWHGPQNQCGMERFNQEDVFCIVPGTSRRLTDLLWLCKLFWSCAFTRRGH